MQAFTQANPPSGFYTYAYIREDGTPWYIGKGTQRRAWKKHGGARRWSAPANEFILFLKWGLTEEQAFAHEEYLIGVFGLESEGGCLSGNQVGGGGGVAGYKASIDELASRKNVANNLERYDTTAEEWLGAGKNTRNAFQAYLKQNPEITFGQYLAGERNKRVYTKEQVEKARRTRAFTTAAQYGADVDEWLALTRKERVTAMAWINNNPGSTYVDFVNRSDQAAIAKSALSRMAKGAAKNGVAIAIWSKLSSRDRKVVAKRVQRGWTPEQALEGLAA